MLMRTLRFYGIRGLGNDTVYPYVGPSYPQPEVVERLMISDAARHLTPSGSGVATPAAGRCEKPCENGADGAAGRRHSTAPWCGNPICGSAGSGFGPTTDGAVGSRRTRSVCRISPDKLWLSQSRKKENMFAGIAATGTGHAAGGFMFCIKTGCSRPLWVVMERASGLGEFRRRFLMDRFEW